MFNTHRPLTPLEQILMNYVWAHPGCTAEDVLNVIKTIRERVFDRNQIHLECEVQIWP